jgi:hypothetical protein
MATSNSSIQARLNRLLQDKPTPPTTNSTLIADLAPPKAAKDRIKHNPTVVVTRPYAELARSMSDADAAIWLTFIAGRHRGPSLYRAIHQIKQDFSERLYIEGVEKGGKKHSTYTTPKLEHFVGRL